ncbi:nuclear transport factor 2 family protein [Ferruginibacter sp.]
MQTVTATKSNIEIAQEGFANFGSGNIAAIIDTCTENVNWASWYHPQVPYSTTFKGKSGVAKFFSTLAETVDYTAFEPKEFYATGNKVFAKVFHAATVKATGRSFAHDTLMEFTIENEKISAFFAYVDSADELQAFTK